MVKNVEESSFILRVIKPKLDFPEINLQKGTSLGIYTKNYKKILKNFFKILTTPEKYSEKLTINDLVANNSNWIGRSFSHIVIPELWGKNILEILKEKTDRRHLIIISATEDDINQNEYSEISELCNIYKKEGAIVTITNSKKLIEATSDNIIDEKGNKISYQTGLFFEEMDGKEIKDINNIEPNLKNIRIKKMKMLINENTNNFNMEDLLK